ncbi:MAG: hypothetical protein KJO41_08135 [Bacteroidia bacterium]|nr:hypothetical protein [Bacteroidia bacterium]MBT8278956.1 hypothetical protein [Bacteroidia bacterium]NNK60630.1 hypothetical protein [Flavobacteriaceae bacterium]NNL32180.1 hypothetical protein [Flavobacteriaceae bacterium]
MKNTVILFILACSYSLVSAQNGEWETMRDVDKNYRIDFPATPQASNEDVPTDLGPVTMFMYMLDLSTDQSAKNIIYMTAFSEYPASGADYKDESLQQSMLDGSVDGAVKNVNGTLVSVEKIKFNGFNGRFAKVSIYNDSYLIFLKNILVDNKLYFIQVITTPEHDNNADLKRFFNSFDLLKTQ